MTVRYLHQVTLTTGRVSVSARDEVSPDFYPNTSALLAAALDGSRPQVPDVEPPAVRTGTARGPCLLATVWRVGEDGQLAPLLTVGVAPRTSRSGAPLWRRLHRVSTELSTRGDRAPEQPWCASRLEPDLLSYPEAVRWIGCLERCIAWTWTRYVEEGAWPGLS
jgi:hypothetical protein